MRSTCFIAVAAALSCADAFCVSPRMSGDVLAPFQAGKALKVRCTAELLLWYAILTPGHLLVGGANAAFRLLLYS